MRGLQEAFGEFVHSVLSLSTEHKLIMASFPTKALHSCVSYNIDLYQSREVSIMLHFQTISQRLQMFV